MDYKRQNNTIVLRLDKDEEILESILSVANKENIRFASVSGIGATDNFDIGIFDLEKKDYNIFNYNNKNFEITSLVGNINTFNGENYVHLHINAACDNGKIVGGHLLKGNISLTAEIVINAVEMTVERQRDDILGINKLTF